MGTIELEGVRNVRDFGDMPASGGIIRSGLFFRGSTLANATEHDCRILFDELEITCIIDLRTGWERSEKPDVKVEGVDNLHIPFYDLEKVGIEYTEPAKGTKVIGKDVACNPDSFYRSLANPLTVAQMRAGLAEVFGRTLHGRAVYEHCSGGKDRAGVLALLILTVLGASREDILEDYLLTNVSRDANYDKEFARFLKLADGDEQRAREITYAHRARPENLDAFYEAIEERYRSMEEFVREGLGISDKRRDEIRAACIE